MKKIPYGESSFKKIRENNMYYVDKTMYIEKLELMPEYLFFIRPRRFGKSLFINMLGRYYDIKEKENFNKLFENLYVNTNKTPYASKYLVLEFDFSSLISDMGKERLVDSFDNIVATRVEVFLKKYQYLIGDYELPQYARQSDKALAFLEATLMLSDYKIVLLIDEYDNYANTIMTANKDLYYEIIEEDGYIRTFYKTLKAMTKTVITRIFMTGVSPLLLDDLTSGANIFTNATDQAMLNNMMGFNQEEVETLFRDFKIAEKVDYDKLLTDVKYLYNGYKFNETVKETIYNTDMILYLVNNIAITGKYPKNILDENVKTDYVKIRKLATNFGNSEELQNIILHNKEVGPITLPDRIKLEDLYSKDTKDLYYKAFMYYLGMLTIKREDEGSVILGIPNYVIKSLYWEYLMKHLELLEVNVDTDENLKLAMRKMRREADLTDIMEIYKKTRKEILSKEDLKWNNELVSKVVFIMLARRDGMYIIKSEKETSEGYLDIHFKAATQYSQYIKYDYVIEFKHINESEVKTKIQKDIKIKTELKKASLQLEKYMCDENIKNESDKEIKKLVVITIGKNDVVYSLHNA